MKIANAYLIRNSKKYCIYILALSFFILNSSYTIAQYTLNGAATKDNCNCYTLTPDIFYKVGSVWNNTAIDLSLSFNYTFNIYAGCSDDRGADGMAFVLQTSLKSIGDTGRELGLNGITPSLGVTLDTYQNLSNSDPLYDHIAVQINGNVNHNSTDNLAGPVKASLINDNIEDCNWHVLKVTWDAVAKKLDVYYDGILRLSLNKDFIADVFNDNPIVYWGFTGATGGFGNLQKFCTPLSADFGLSPTQKRCVGENIRFYDSSATANSIKRFWDFGDGSPVDSLNVNPVHIYSTANDFPVTLTVKGIDGCIETKTKIIRIGTIPIANYTVRNPCQENLVLLDSSYTGFGTINSWYWSLGNGTTSAQRAPAAAFTTPGLKQVSLTVKTAEGCVSDTVFKSTIVDRGALPEMLFSDACKNTVVNFEAIDSKGANVSKWYWNFGDGAVDSGIISQHNYLATGKYPVQLYAVTRNGCISEIREKTINIYGTNAGAGPDITAAALQPVQLSATGGTSYKWSPFVGLNNPNISNPVAILVKDQTYFLKAFTPEGCESFDTISIKIYKGPEIYVPNAFSPDNDGLNDVFKVIAVGVVQFNFLKIYNRWGKEIFTTPDFRHGWDGTYNSKKQPPGIYVWRTSGFDFKGNQIIKKGIVMLLR